MTTQKEVDVFPKGIYKREGKEGDGFVLVISIAIWNQMHIGSVPWNNESVNVH